ncbi:hypothetical protein Q5O14_16395 [Eubacteriaceae bacterium ES2]|nr:hypothetical protein Q5O14_16395 [Eubacteriaceae bacterium ES2]
MNYSFDIGIAEELGVNAAIVISNLQFWITKNQANGKHFHDDRYWTFNSIKAWKDLFPFWSERQIRKILDDLTDKEILIKGNFNEVKYDRTLWYAFSDYGISICQNCQMKQTFLSNRTDENVEPIPDINTDINTDVNTDTIESTAQTEKTSSETRVMKVEKKETAVSKKDRADNVIQAYNKIATRLPKVTAQTDKRIKAINAMLKKYDSDVITGCFSKANASDFLTGNNGNAWKASFDWIINNNNFVKILEGNYDNRQKVPRNMQAALSNLHDETEAEIRGGSIFD